MKTMVNLFSLRLISFDRKRYLIVFSFAETSVIKDGVVSLYKS